MKTASSAFSAYFPALALGGFLLTTLPALAQKPAAPAVAFPHVYISGAVVKPGSYRLKPGSRMIDALDLAEPKEGADLGHLYMVHFDKAQRGSQQDVNLNQFLLRNDIKGNPLIGYGDTIYVPRRKNYVPQPPEFVN